MTSAVSPSADATRQCVASSLGSIVPWFSITAPRQKLFVPI